MTRHSHGQTWRGSGAKAGWQLTKSRRRLIAQVVSYFLLTIGGVVMALPFFWLISSSLKKPAQIFIIPPQWIPNPPKWSNYVELFTLLPFELYTRNTLIIVVGTVSGQLITGSMAAYAFSRLRWPGRDLVFVALLATMMLPGAVTMIPVFIIFKTLGWLNTFLPLIVPYWFGGGAFYIFLLRQFFLTIPMELEDAARMDGASSFIIYTRIMLPLARPALAVVAIFSFMSNWNAFMGPLIYLSSNDKWTLALGIQALQGLEWGRDMTELLMGAGFIMILPTLILFIVAQDIFVRGVTLTGIKG